MGRALKCIGRAWAAVILESRVYVDRRMEIPLEQVEDTYEQAAWHDFCMGKAVEEADALLLIICMHYACFEFRYPLNTIGTRKINAT